MQRGKDLEPIARGLYVETFGVPMEPLCGESDDLGFMASSFDGVNFAKEIALEIKCPGQKDHDVALAGRVPDKYAYQLAQQFFVSELSLIHYVSYSPQTASMAVVEVRRDDKMIKNLVEKSIQFWEKVLKNEWS